MNKPVVFTASQYMQSWVSFIKLTLASSHCCWSSGCGGLGARHFPADTRVCFFTLANFAISDNCWLFFSSKLGLVFLLSWILIFCLLSGSSQSVVSLCVFNEIDVLLPVTEDRILLHFCAKPFFFLLLDGLPKPARELKFIGSAFYRPDQQNPWL